MNKELEIIMRLHRALLKQKSPKRVYRRLFRKMVMAGHKPHTVIQMIKQIKKAA